MKEIREENSKTGSLTRDYIYKQAAKTFLIILMKNQKK